MTKNKSVVFTGGGTGGHVYPAQPLIKKFQEMGYDVHWIGSRGGIEKRIVSTWNLDYREISTGKLRRYFSFRNFTDIFRIIRGFFQSLILLNRLKPVLVFSKGGFVSVPPVLAAHFLKIPSYTHDSDVTPGLATKINNKTVKKTFVAYQESKNILGKNDKRVVVSGNPVRADFYDKKRELPRAWKERVGNRPLILVLGGSSGANQVNELVGSVAGELCKKYCVIHQMGDKLFDDEGKISHYHPVPYINEELPALLQRADLAISRAGAGTLWELALTETPSVLIPLKSGSRGDQVVNAEIMKKRGLSEIWEEGDSSDFLNMLRTLLEDKERLAVMKNNCRDFMEKKAEDVMMEYLSEVI